MGHGDELYQPRIQIQQRFANCLSMWWAWQPEPLLTLCSLTRFWGEGGSEQAGVPFTSTGVGQLPAWGETDAACVFPLLPLAIWSYVIRLHLWWEQDPWPCAQICGLFSLSSTGKLLRVSSQSKFLRKLLANNTLNTYPEVNRFNPDCSCLTTYFVYLMTSPKTTAYKSRK